jgi:translation initiation factor IF-3
VTEIAKGVKTVRINERIRVPQVRLIDQDGNMVGITATREALEIARDRGFDLVEVSPGASPPVCRIMDYGKYKYEQSKKAKRAKKKQHIMHVKEIKMRPKIETHDYGFKMNHARKFLEHNNKVKFSLIFRGREVTHPDIGLNILKRVAEELSEIATVEAGPKREGMTMMMVVCPRPGAIKETDKNEKATEEVNATHKNGGEVEEKAQEST